MPQRSLVFSRGGLISALTLAAFSSWLPARSELLYSLQTQCSLAGAAAVACTVEAINSDGVTQYRHRIGSQVQTIRITDKPVRMSRWDAASKSWRPLTGASAQFSSNTICFDGRDLCVVNPNYLNSVLEGNTAAMEGRDVVKVHFGSDGRINASCYDDGCGVSLQ